ncbi:hypothetical protein ACSBR1_016204 [Camellia fascicularis]
MGISSRNIIVHLTLLLYISCGFAMFSEATNKITQTQLLKNGQTIVSSGQNFVLGFFSPPNSTFQYIGIWYNNISVQTVIWVANRNSPITDKNGVLAIGNNGNLMVLDGNGTSIWSSNASVVAKNTTAMRMDTGNLILSSDDSAGDIDNALWQSFDNPTDTFLPGMRVHTNARTDQWRKGDWSGGCIRKEALECGRNGSGDGFLAVEGVNLPDFASTVAAENIEECEDKCLTNCSCNAFAFVIGIRCMMWSGDLVDVEEFAEGGNTLYVRLAKSELGVKNRISTAAITTIVVVGTIVLGVFLWLLWRFRAKIKECSKSLCKRKTELAAFDASKSCEFSADFSCSDDLASIEGKRGSGPELPLFNFNCVAASTNNFANNCKLGQGGFGVVYKGKLEGGQEAAVKRLSIHSGQGAEEFKNEIKLISKLQHRNLVRLLGYCIDGEEKLLVYEYMTNRSLDTFLFDETKRVQLDWAKRFHIIQGIARGILYLHCDSCLRVIHRDLKASNILLDDDMNPKISDFGLARTFRVTQELANTHRVVGTFGYMSPEYAMGGLFSEKSDVFSFGVLLLEIVSGMRNTSFHYYEKYVNLLGYAWQLCNENRASDIMDKVMADSRSESEVMRCICIGLLCVQDHVADRPTMSAVVLMLSSE